MQDPKSEWYKMGAEDSAACQHSLFIALMTSQDQKIIVNIVDHTLVEQDKTAQWVLKFPYRNCV